ncbi:MAG: thioredoxin fold domain-containing protein [Gammaproteobacteria bacterium]|nr:thioredoxin fold domain-containing protein [Gammaproteobacteria bacterium]
MSCRLFACLLALMVPGSGLAVPPPGYSFVPYDEGLALAKRNAKPIFMYLGRHGCGSCLKTNAESFGDARIRELYSEHYVLVYVDTEGSRRIRLASGERVTEMQFASGLRTTGTPRFIYLSSEGTPLLRVPGFRTVAEFRAFDAYIAGGHYKDTSLSKFLKSYHSQ